jgi:hypothetical protein
METEGVDPGDAVAAISAEMYDTAAVAAFAGRAVARTV